MRWKSAGHRHTAHATGRWRGRCCDVLTWIWAAACWGWAWGWNEGGKGARFSSISCGLANYKTNLKDSNDSPGAAIVTVYRMYNNNQQTPKKWCEEAYHCKASSNEVAHFVDDIEKRRWKTVHREEMTTIIDTDSTVIYRESRPQTLLEFFTTCPQLPQQKSSHDDP